MWKLNYTEEKIKQLEIEFDQLNSIEEKFNFWSEKLNMPFYNWSECEFTSMFLISGKSEGETEKINRFSLSQYVKNAGELKKKVYDIVILQNSFYQKYDEIINQSQYIEFEIRKLEQRVAERDGHKDVLHDKTNSYFDNGYSGFYFENKKPELGKEVLEIKRLIALMNGYVFAKYHNFLKGLQNKPVAKNQFTHIQQMLILEYLEIAIHIKDNAAKKAEIYAPIMRRDIETTRQLFSQIRTEKTKKNMSVIYDFFMKNGYPNQAQKVKIDTLKET